MVLKGKLGTKELVIPCAGLKGGFKRFQKSLIFMVLMENKDQVGGNSFRFFTTIFQSLPICYLINNKALVMHGGLPMVDGVVLDDIKKLSRECEPGEQGEIFVRDLGYTNIHLTKYFRHIN